MTQLNPKPLATSKIRAIQTCVAEHYGLSLKSLVGVGRARTVCRPRMMAMYLCVELAGYSNAHVARVFNKDHTTVLHAVRTIRAMVKQYPELEADKAVIMAQVAECKSSDADSGAIFLPVSHVKSEVSNG